MTSEGRKLAELSQAVRESTQKRLRAMPEGQEDWRPAEGAMSVVDLAQHLVDADNWLFKKLKEPDLKRMADQAGAGRLAKPKTVQNLIADLELTGRQRIEILENLSDEVLLSRMDDERFGNVTVWWIIVRGNLDHEAHHRGQLSTYLRIMK